MRKTDIVIGANFGDEGKGLITDYLIEENTKNNNTILNVRFNGGCQASHTVTKLDFRHAFSHFGSGTYHKNNITYLSEYFICNPILFNIEYEKIKHLYPIVYVHPKALITTPWDMFLNQLKEYNRGKSKHGSCGLGIYETIERDKIFSLTIRDIKNDIENKLNEIYTYTKNKLINYNIPVELQETLKNYKDINQKFIEDWKSFYNRIKIENDGFINKFNYVIFEGAQGLLLDQNNTMYYPHLTPSNTGSTNVQKILKNIDVFNKYNINYITRCYLTRHGAGFLPYEYNDRPPESNIIDETNVPNPFQDNIRYGMFNGKLIKYSIDRDSENWKFDVINKKLFITCLDQFKDTIESDFFCKTEKLSKFDFLQTCYDYFNTPELYYSIGPMSTHVNFYTGSYTEV